MPPVIESFVPMMVQVEVTFNVAALEEGPLSTNMTDPLEIPQGLTMIVFRLNTVSTDGTPILSKAVFQTTPIQWLLTGEEGQLTNSPALLPAMFIFQRIGDETVTLLDFNSNPSDEPRDKRHWFNLIVAYEGETYWADPVIINQPPT